MSLFARVLGLGAMLLLGCADDEPAAVERAAARYLAVHNDQDHAAARALWGDQARGAEASIAWFRDRVGTCREFTPMTVKSELRARYVFTCERGEVEVYLRVDGSTGAARRSLFGARGVEPPAQVRHTLEQLVALANAEPATMPEPSGSLAAEQVQAQIAAIARHGRCAIDRVHLGFARGGRFVLECSHGTVTATLDLSREGRLRRFFVDDGAADTWRSRSGRGRA